MIVDSRTGHVLTYFIEGTAFVDMEQHTKDMERFGVDVQVLSVNPPGADRVVDPEEALRLSAIINDELARVVAEGGGRFSALATVPMNNQDVALQEARRALDQLGLRGVNISSNTLGRYYDTGYERFFAFLEKRGAPVFIHPTESVAQEVIGQDYNLPLVFGWPFDTTISVSRLVFSGLMKRLPKLKVVAAHGGGMIPFYAGRLEMLLHDTRGSGRRPDRDSVEMLRLVNYEAALFDENSISLLIRFAGEDRVVYGTDYPFGGSSAGDCYRVSGRVMRRLAVSDRVRQKVLWRNASRLLNL
jgi:aminocarboxymuconate-semialdehyde decarboxylase